REPRQNGRRPDARDRHRSGARRLRARTGAARKPAGVRQDHRDVLVHDPEKWAPVFGQDHAQTKPVRMSISQRSAGRRLKAGFDALVGWFAVAILKCLRAVNRQRMANMLGRLLRAIGPWLPEHRVGRANLVAAFPEKTPEEIEKILAGVWDNLGRVAAEFAHIDRVTLPERGEHGGG